MLERDRILPFTISRRAQTHGDQVALQDVGGRSCTYREYDEANRRWADALRRQGVQPGQTVLTFFTNSFESLHCWLGLAWLGAIEVPINTQFRAQMLEYLIENSRAELMVTSERFLEQLSEVRPQLLSRLRALIVPDLTGEVPHLGTRVIDGGEFLGAAEPAADLDGPAHYDVSCMIYTSGTTGPSKGVLVPWAELHQFPNAAPPGILDESSSYYACLPTFHVGGKSLAYMTALHSSKAVLREVFSLSEFWSDVRSFGCNTTGLIGIMAQLLLTMPEQPDDADNPLTTIQTAPLFPEIEEFERRFGVKTFTGYGMTEIGAPLYVGHDDRVDWRSCGRIRPGYELRIVDEHDEELPHGEVGELIVRSDRPWELNSGYWGMPEKTAEAWRNGWFHTGDGFRRDAEGNYYFVDRLKDAMRKGGENISSLEVEGYVREHPSVQEVAAIAAPSDFGHGEDEVKLLVIPKPGENLDEAGLLEFLVPVMPKFMLPRYVELVEELPKTQTLRVRKVELRDDALNARTWDRVAGGYVEEARWTAGTAAEG